MSLAGAVSIADIRAAAGRIAGIAHRTPLHHSRRLDGLVGCRTLLKCENFQRVGAFKFRGAYNAVRQLASEARGVLTYSSGNHAQAIALAGAELGRRAVIVMPSNAPAIKRAATEAYLEQAAAGSGVVEYDPASGSREEIGRTIAAEEGLSVIPPYDHPHVIAGQGTVGLELIEQAGELDAVFVPCGGGGLLSGVSIAVKALAPGCCVIGVEPELGDDATRSFRTRRLCTVHNPPTIADGARTPYLGRYTFPMVLSNVDQMMTVSDAELASAALLLIERLKLVVEPTGALGLAGLIRQTREGKVDFRRVGVVISGGNLDPGAVAELLRLRDAG
ncbi:MAG: pyridoxal-phosphate dependent enzyme [Leptolyngbya sp. PLA3]|nr:MAG: pyridoxal-phosphate dependent enzyme [Cyanobacteria bacterium CYA]MCE7968651.1 pyridoxal-phosphate dependent enzyme [Leptolyngbya sp. PL-A3]